MPSGITVTLHPSAAQIVGVVIRGFLPRMPMPDVLSVTLRASSENLPRLGGTYGIYYSGSSLRNIASCSKLFWHPIVGRALACLG